jgi:hypothetical protein
MVRRLRMTPTFIIPKVYYEPATSAGPSGRPATTAAVTTTDALSARDRDA